MFDSYQSNMLNLFSKENKETGKSLKMKKKNDVPEVSMFLHSGQKEAVKETDDDV